MSEQPAMPRSWTPGAIRELAMSFQSSRILLTAVELRVFSLIEVRQAHLGRTGTAARACHPHAIDRLLNALCAMHLLEKRDGRFRNTAGSRRFLDDSEPRVRGGARAYRQHVAQPGAASPTPSARKARDASRHQRARRRPG